VSVVTLQEIVTDEDVTIETDLVTAIVVIVHVLVTVRAIVHAQDAIVQETDRRVIVIVTDHVIDVIAQETDHRVIAHVRVTDHVQHAATSPNQEIESQEVHRFVQDRVVALDPDHIQEQSIHHDRDQDPEDQITTRVVAIMTMIVA
jgi:hypothetical protein